MPDLRQYPFTQYGLNVSRETCEKFNRYIEILLKWQKAVNLISASTLENLAERHFLDSVQLIKYIPDLNITMADMGSGAGFPGLVLAMMGVSNVHLIESDVRKATFLREVSRETSTPVVIHDDRVEDVKITGLDLVTARALAPLVDLLSMTQKLSCTSALFLKGEKTTEELERAQKRWNFIFESHQSITEKTGKILKINNLTKK